MAYSLDPISDNCYPGTAVLINKRDIRDEQKLDDVETLITMVKMAELEVSPLPGEMDFAYYRAIHKYLFDELYDWAGEIRTVNISKKGTRFCPYDQIEEHANLIFTRLEQMNFFKGLAHDVFVSEIVDFYCATNDLHPFREGNGRTQRTFLIQLIKSAGYTINFSEVDEDLLMIATIQSASGITDNLLNIFKEAIK